MSKKSPHKKSVPNVLVKNDEGSDVVSSSHHNPENLFKKIFIGTAVVLFLLMTILSFDYGITGDENLQNEYGTQVLNYYLTFGKDTSSLYFPKYLLHLYGGLFDGLAAFCNRFIGGLDEFDMRHLLNAIFGFVAMLFTGLLAKELGGWRAGLFGLVIIAVTPTFFGHSMNNPKDIPFATTYILSLYFMIRLFGEFPKPKIKTIVFLILSIGASINVRVGGILLIAYFVFFYLIEIFSQTGLKNFFKTDGMKTVRSKLPLIILISVLGYFAGMLVWPYGLQNPFSNPLTALKEMSNYSVSIRMLFEGEHLTSSEIPWYYIPKWMLITLPLFVLLGTALFIPSVFLSKSSNKKYLLMLVFTIVFPVSYAVYKKSILYDSWRHFLFIYPSLVVLNAWTWNHLLEVLKNNVSKIIIISVLAILIFLPLKWMIVNHPHEYIYFNETVGGLKGAYGKYETDYYMNAIKPATRWLMKSDEYKKNPGKFTVITNCTRPLTVYLAKDSSKVNVGYTRFNERGDKEWDYGIFYSRFIDKSQLKNRSWLLKKNIHMVEADGIPLAVVVKREDKSDYNGFQALNKQDFKSAVDYFTKAVAYDDRNEQAWMGLGQAYLNTGNLPMAVNALQKSLNIYPDNQSALNMLGVTYLRNREFDRSILTFDRLIKISPGYDYAYLNTGVAYAQKGDLDNAIRYLKFTLQINPNIKDAYLYLANIYQQKGDAKAAQEYMAKANEMK